MLDPSHQPYTGFTDDELNRTYAWVAARRHLLVSQYQKQSGAAIGPTERNRLLTEDLRLIVGSTMASVEHTTTSTRPSIENLALDNEAHLETLALLDELSGRAGSYAVDYRTEHIGAELTEKKALLSRDAPPVVRERFREIVRLRDTVEHMLTHARADAVNAGLSPELLINDAALRIDLSDRFETSHEQTEHLEEIAAKVAEAKTIADNQAATVAEKTRQKKRQQRDGEMEF